MWFVSGGGPTHAHDTRGHAAKTRTRARYAYLVLEGVHDHNGAKHLLLHDGHAGRHVTDDGGREVVPLLQLRRQASGALAAAQHRRALLTRHLHKVSNLRAPKVAGQDEGGGANHA